MKFRPATLSVRNGMSTTADFAPAIMAHTSANAAGADPKWLFHGSRKGRPMGKISSSSVSSAI
jgi:hypothetical protein